MLDDFQLINWEFDETESIDIVCISDVHLGSLGQAQREWEEFCDKVKETPNLYLVLGGDLVNNSIRNSVANPFDETIRPRTQKQMMVQYLNPIKDRILCSVSGNHEYRTTRETDQDISYDIMSKLDLEEVYRENAAFIKIDIGKRPSEDKPRVSYVICVTHGSGGGVLPGSTINKNERFMGILEGVDALVVGHSHRAMVSKPSRLVVDPYNGIVQAKPFTVVSMCSWLNYGGYALRKMLLPSSVCDPQILHLSGRWDNKKISVTW